MAGIYDVSEEESSELLSVIVAQILLVWVNEHRERKLSINVLREVCQYFEIFSPVTLVRWDAQRVFSWKTLQWGPQMAFSEQINVNSAFPLPQDRVLCKVSGSDNQCLLKKRGEKWEVKLLPNNTKHNDLPGMLYDRGNVYFFGYESRDVETDDLSVWVSKGNIVTALDLNSFTLTDLPQMKFRRGNFTPVAYKRRAYIIGGAAVNPGDTIMMRRYERESWMKYEKNTADELEVFNLDTRVFEHSFTISIPMGFYQMFVLRNRLYIFSQERAGSIDLEAPGRIRKEKVASIPGNRWVTHQSFLYCTDGERCYQAPLKYPFVWTTLFEQ